MERDKKILYVDFGGLGDHLALSTLPKVCHENKTDFYLSDRCKFRDNQIFKLVWELNPYFKGFTSEEPNCGHDGYTDLNNYNYELSIHRNFEIKMGFENTILEGENKYGEIYYEPKKIEDYDDFILLDLNSVTISNYNINIIKENLLKYSKNKILYLLPTYAKNLFNDNFFESFNIEYITTKDIFHYCDLIFSCKIFICLWSGSSVLSSIIKNKYKEDLEINCFKNYNIHQSFGTTDKTHFWYENINYINC
jgi:hypothetical protein